MKKTFEIILIIAGLILGSLASITTTMTATQVIVTTNQDTKVKIKEDGNLVSKVTVPGKSMLPVHNKNNNMMYSPTLSVDNLTGYDNGDNYIAKSYDVSIDKDIENAHLQVELILSEDTMTGTVRALVNYGGEIHILSAQDNIVTFENTITTKSKAFGFTLYYEMEDESCTIENINASTGVDVEVNLYAYVTE